LRALGDVRNAVAMYFRYIGVSLRSQMQYRGSFAMMTFGHFAITGIEFLGMWALFNRFDSIQGWRLPEVAFMYGIVNIAFAVADAGTRAFDMFGTMVKSGDFDRVLLRPRSTALQLAGQELTLRRVGRLIQGVAVLVFATVALEVDWTAAKVLLTAGAIVGGAALFSGLVILQATLAFWSTETLEIMNTVTYGGVETAQYPLDIYRSWFRRFFIYAVPLATISYFPTLAVLDRPGSLGSGLMFQYMSPLIGIAFLLACLQMWKFGVRHYCSTGS
jgi:ABC-2 type transport system permease protein